MVIYGDRDLVKFYIQSLQSEISKIKVKEFHDDDPLLGDPIFRTFVDILKSYKRIYQISNKGHQQFYYYSCVSGIFDINM